MEFIYDIGRQRKSASMESDRWENLTFRLTNIRFSYNYLALIRCKKKGSIPALPG